MREAPVVRFRGFYCFGCGVGFALTSPVGGALDADQRARADPHHAWAPSLALHFEIHVLADVMPDAKCMDRHRERLRVRALRLAPVLRTIIRRCRLFAGNFWTRHRRHSAQTRWRTIRLNEIFPEAISDELR